MLPAIGAGQTIHTPHDPVPNFAAAPTIRSAGSGAWSGPATWNPARLPTPADVVSISHEVVFDTARGEAAVVGIEAGGVLRFSTVQSTRLRTGTLLVLPGGGLEVSGITCPLTGSPGTPPTTPRGVRIVQ
jgi:hypothetical protein